MGLRNFLRPFRGVSKWYLAGYVAIFEWANNLKRVTDGFLGLLLGTPHSTDTGSCAKKNRIIQKRQGC